MIYDALIVKNNSFKNNFSWMSKDITFPDNSECSFWQTNTAQYSYRPREYSSYTELNNSFSRCQILCKLQFSFQTSISVVGPGIPG